MLDIEAINHERLRFSRFVRSTDTPALLVSAEAFSLARTQREANAISSFFGGLGLEITPVLVIREDVEWQQSYEAQMTRGGYSGDIVNGLPDARRIDRDWVFNTQAIRDFWHGIGPLRAIGYEEAVAHDGSVIPSLLRAVDLPGELGAEADYFFNRRRTGTS